MIDNQSMWTITVVNEHSFHWKKKSGYVWIIESCLDVRPNIQWGIQVADVQQNTLRPWTKNQNCGFDSWNWHEHTMILALTAGKYRCPNVMLSPAFSAVKSRLDTSHFHQKRRSETRSDQGSDWEKEAACVTDDSSKWKRDWFQRAFQPPKWQFDVVDPFSKVKPFCTMRRPALSLAASLITAAWTGGFYSFIG